MILFGQASFSRSLFPSLPSGKVQVVFSHNWDRRGGGESRSCWVRVEVGRWARSDAGADPGGHARLPDADWQLLRDEVRRNEEDVRGLHQQCFQVEGWAACLQKALRELCWISSLSDNDYNCWHTFCLRTFSDSIYYPVLLFANVCNSQRTHVLSCKGSNIKTTITWNH